LEERGDRTLPACARAVFQQRYDRKDYQAAFSTLSPVLTQCGQTPGWDEEGNMRNDVAIVQDKTAQYAPCLETLR
jgi:homoserine kinase